MRTTNLSIAALISSAFLTTLALAQNGPGNNSASTPPTMAVPPPVSDGMPVWVYLLGAVVVIGAVALIYRARNKKSG